jgi:hypothetical protein
MLLSACIGAEGRQQIGELLESSVSSKPEEIAQMAQGVADFSVPEGFEADYGMKLAVFTMVAYRSPSDVHVMLMQFPSGTKIDEDQMMEQLVNATKDQNQTFMTTKLRQVEQRPVEVRGKDAVMTISVGKEGESDEFTQAAVAFEGKGGPALLVIAGKSSAYDQQMVDQFVASLQ